MLVYVYVQLYVLLQYEIDDTKEIVSYIIGVLLCDVI